ncbi:Deoxyribose-phosphate aldolase [uncultured Roseburia sp.]|uniref:Deoxyribose-phosphate aldolase n=1 Tax=Brotonthovivens ammoniilytica TaxID=2981725 RepID=A0ABT2TG19_9FIRM|nr:deoxyribose-phosphate aldolase [Brotonthovivens ammoniilytica]MCU6761135.1 deoxyribose-phosphate aldolase [Brotonthovivens ammoniilytica]SCI19923.1 Deoxyribose-phosphate aldolase [uncultured Roseburia sp.]
MKKEELYRYVDHTALKAFTTWEEIDRLCKEALLYHMASVCIPGCYIKKVHEVYPDLSICTVVGFPLGNCNTAAKAAETRQALADGAAEIDMVINIAEVKNGNYEAVREEIRLLKEITKEHILKVIIETCYLNEDEKIAMCQAVTEAGADYIKTSTGFGTGGAVLSDVKLMKKHIGPNVKIKAAGGIRSQAEMEAMIAAGADRIGTSSAITMLEAGEQR